MIKLIITFIYTLIFLINNQECPKDEPIYASEGCKYIYCDENDFQNGDCIISNPIIKIQWLNKLIFFGGHDGFTINLIQMPNNDIFIICSDYTQEKIYIYGLKSS